MTIQYAITCLFHIMQVVIALSMLTGFCAAFLHPAIVQKRQQDLYVFKSRSRTVYLLLEKECPEKVRAKRDTFLSGGLKNLHRHHKIMLRMLVECRRLASTDQKTATLVTKTSTAASTTTTTPTTTITTTAVPMLPSECLSARNFSEAWRNYKDYKITKLAEVDGSGDPDMSGSGDDEDFSIDYESTCDLGPNLGWFRFTGAAGKIFIVMCRCVL